MSKTTGTVVALGMFDGVHLGHRALIRLAVETARERGGSAVVYTFSNHPAEVLGGVVRLLSGPEERRKELLSLGVAEVRMEPFTRELAAMTPEAFVERLRTLWKVSGVAAGFNYTFGARGAGTPETLSRLGERYGFTVNVAPAALYRGEPVSSTRIRAALEAGEAADAAEMLTRPYTLCGTVIANRRIGRRIGFPTANIAPDPARVLPENGVYATVASADGKSYPAVTNIGTNPTVGGRMLSIESHLLDYDGDLYGRELSVSFRYRIRGERTFSSVEELKNQIAQDAENVRKAAFL